MLIEVISMIDIPKRFVPLTMRDHVVGAASEESVMLGYCCPNGSICDSLVFSFSMDAKEVKYFYHHLQEVQRQV